VSTEEQTSLADDIGDVYDELSSEVEETDADNVVEDAAEEEVAEVIDEEVAEEADETVGVESEGQTDEVEEVPEDIPVETDEETAPLAHWKMEDKEYFKTLPDDAKKFLVERDKEFQRQASNKVTEVMHIKRALEPIHEEMAQFGVSDDQAVRTLVGAHMMLKNDPKKGIQHLMGQYGLTPETLFSQDDTQDTVDPRIVNLENKAMQYEQNIVAQEQATLAGRIDEFRKNAEFFDEVQGEMTQLAVIERARNPNVTPDIEMLYNRACRMNEAVWEKLESKRRAAGGRVEANNRSANAAGSKVRPTAASKRNKAKTGPRSMREDLEASWDEVEEHEQGTAL